MELDRFSLIKYICWGGGGKIYEVKSSQREKNEKATCSLKEDKRNLCDWRYLIISVTGSLWIPSWCSGIFVTLSRYILAVIIQDKLAILIYSRGNWGLGKSNDWLKDKQPGWDRAMQVVIFFCLYSARSFHVSIMCCNWWVHFSQTAHMQQCCGSHLRGWRHSSVPAYRETSGNCCLEHRLSPDWCGTYRVISQDISLLYPVSRCLSL